MVTRWVRCLLPAIGMVLLAPAAVHGYGPEQGQVDDRAAAGRYGGTPTIAAERRAVAQNAAPAAADAAQERDAKARNYFTETELVDQNGRRLRFYSDVLRGKTVLISMFYTSCKDACPLINAALQQVQAALGERVGDDIALISISVDPETDTPAVVAAYAQRFEPGSGWLFLTGDPGNVNEVVRRLGHAGPVDAHTSVLVLGNVTEAKWTRMPPNLPPEAIATRLRLLADGGFGAGGG